MSPSTEPSIVARVRPLSEVRSSPDWQKWHDLSAHAPPFLSPEFFALSAPLAGDGELLVAEAFRDDALVGALPLRLEGHTLEALRTDHTPSFDFWGARGALESTWSALRKDRRWDVLLLKNVPKGSVLATELPSLAKDSGCPAVVRAGARHLYIELPGFESRLSPKFLTNLKRVERKAGKVEFERLCHVTRSDLSQALAIEAMAWKGGAGTSIDRDVRAAHLYASLARLMGPRGRASLAFLRIDGRRVAMLFSVEDDTTQYALKLGYDPALSNLSPGQLLIWKAAADAERRGLVRFDFVGRDDEWKRKWTELYSEQVSVLIYRRSLRGLGTWALREQVKPRLPRNLRDPKRVLWSGCQKPDIVGDHSLGERVRGRVDRGLGIRSGLTRLARVAPHADGSLGEASKYPPGTWVRVLDAEAIEKTLGSDGRMRGLEFVPVQRDTAGGVFRVEAHVRRIRDDHGRFRPVARTVLLQGVTCAGDGETPRGCGRHCPLWYRDEWLEPAEPPRREPPKASVLAHVRVRSLEEIQAGLDLRGRRDGVSFLPEMSEFADKRFHALARIDRVFEYDAWVPTRRPLFILQGVACKGASVGRKGPCDRACALLWHEDWLLFETPAVGARAEG
ncbi:MAG: GNAT family N-acetyltransferase [Polyangiaceae bacterium]